MTTVNRRTFMKVGAAGAAGLTLAGSAAVRSDRIHAVGASSDPINRVTTNAPGGDDKPLLRLEAGGPTTFVTSLAFSPDGKTLYAADTEPLWTRRFAVSPVPHFAAAVGPLAIV